MEPIILASSSPRRQEILQKLKIPYRVITANIDETLTNMLKNEEVPEFLAREKVSMVLKSLPQGQEIPWILGADTIVLYKNKIYGKPKNQEEAFENIKLFQGNTHKVITSIVLYNGKTKNLTSKTVITEVTFNAMTDEEIQWYVDTGEWHGAAGGYRIQESASLFVNKINGSYSSVIGLPINALFDILKEQGYSILE